ncbi:unnamed protein product [Triticum turgidum subsp. durum]|uniref:Uncharacterized protein n=1 Tax=Triticum turgidum subsp. durum TaxID=4567 RepID=A0A9R1ASV1_TRITD|nr:unnamed protein product [Triticum turgidum subsp. durum]
MGSKQQPALRPSSTDGGCGGDGRAASVSERSSVTNASFRVYYSLRAGAVPFVWEVLPPPPSPPPSYQSPFHGKGRRPSWTATPGGIVRALLGVLGLRKRHRRSRRRPDMSCL